MIAPQMPTASSFLAIAIARRELSAFVVVGHRVFAA
jgi:hypothetical protein